MQSRNLPGVHNGDEDDGDDDEGNETASERVPSAICHLPDHAQ